MRQRRKTAATTGRPSRQPFIFCTGIENSYPVITNKAGLRERRDGMKLLDHYGHWQKDLRLVKEMGITHLRYGPPYYRAHAGPMRYDWSFADKSFAMLRRLKIEPIVDLCHFGVPDWTGDFQNPEWPELFADYAAAFARRFPWTRLFTPVNEIFVAARFSAQLGWWNEQQKSDRAFVTALKHMARATILAEEAILKVQPDAVFIQSESSQYFHAAAPSAQGHANFLNQKRFLPMDLCFGFDCQGVMYEYLMDNGMSREEYHWFLEHGRAMRPHAVMGSDYYVTNEYRVLPAPAPDDGKAQARRGPDPLRVPLKLPGLSGELPPGSHGAPDSELTAPAGEVFGYYVICHQYFDRYRLPVMYTETNRKDPEAAPAWLWKEWANVLRLRHDGVPILGFTWYSLTDQIDWDTALREDNHRVNPLGLYDLKRRIRPVGEAYRQLIEQWRGRLPMEDLYRPVVQD
jgi:beta-glucosidase/6-phospho-beta-glucosidase/beta-galactosidase